MGHSTHHSRPSRRTILSHSGLAVCALSAFSLRPHASLAEITTPSATRSIGLKSGEKGLVRYISGGDVFTLNSGNGLDLKVKLASIDAPQNASRSQNKLAWPFSRQANTALAGLIEQRDIQLFYGGKTRDRYDRALAQVFTLSPDGTPDLWVQEEMVRLGLARIFTWPNERVDSGRLYRAERSARDAGRGIWSHEFYAVRDPDPNNLAQYVDSAQVVEGIILSVADVRGRIYMNFGVDYKTDFTIVIAKKNVKTFTKADIDLPSLEGARVRVRGWIELVNGPAIWLDHPQRLEILS